MLNACSRRVSVYVDLYQRALVLDLVLPRRVDGDLACFARITVV